MQTADFAPVLVGKPLGSRVVLEAVVPEDTKILTATAINRGHGYRVVAIGDGGTLHGADSPVEVEIGDHVALDKGVEVVENDLLPEGHGIVFAHEIAFKVSEVNVSLLEASRSSLLQ